MSGSQSGAGTVEGGTSARCLSASPSTGTRFKILIHGEANAVCKLELVEFNASFHGQVRSQGLLAVPTVYVQYLCTRQDHCHRSLIKVHETSFTDVLSTIMLTDLFLNHLVEVRDEQ